MTAKSFLKQTGDYFLDLLQTNPTGIDRAYTILTVSLTTGGSTNTKSSVSIHCAGQIGYSFSIHAEESA